MALDDNPNTKGCPRNPFSQYEFTNYIGVWPGGWVRDDSDMSIHHYNSNFHVTITYQRGERRNPYTESEHQELVNEGEWMGGWIMHSDNSIQFFDILSQAGERLYIGQRENPYYEIEFNDLINVSWHGGWVEYENGGLYYINSNGEEGNDPMANISGCGCGCGSGCGCDYPGPNAGKVSSGSGIICSNTLIQVYVSWTTGYLTHEPFSSLSLGVNFADSNYELVGNYAYPRWTGEYGILVDGYFVYRITTSQVVHEVHFLPGVYIVPSQYRIE